MPNDQALLKRFMDEVSIRNTIARFADSVTRFDNDMFRTVWADDAEFILGHAPHGQSATGVDDIVAMLQFALPGVIEIDGDEATTRTFCHEAARGPGKTYYRNHCIASDRLRRAGDGWVFASRSFQYLWLDTSPFTGDAFPLLPTVAAA
jgi:hypothetical protein